MEAQHKPGFGIVGLGIGRAHMDAAAASGLSTLAAVCDIVPEKLEKAKKKYPYVHTYENFEEMLADPGVDIVSICLPSGMHADFAVRAMAAGKHVLIEKPIDTTEEAARRVIEARDKYGVRVGVVHQNRYNACMAPIKKAVDSGRLGRLILGNFAVKWFREQSYYENGWHGTWNMDGGGSLMNQAIHTIDLMRWLMGEVTSVRSVMGIYAHKIETEDMTASVITFKNGAAATFVSTTCAYPGISTDIQLYGTGGTIEADADVLRTWKMRDSADEEAEEEEMLRLYGAGNGGACSADPALLVGHQAVIEDMADAVINGRDPFVPPEEAIKSVRIVEAIYKSARTGEVVFLD